MFISLLLGLRNSFLKATKHYATFHAAATVCGNQLKVPADGSRIYLNRLEFLFGSRQRLLQKVAREVA